MTQQQQIIPQLAELHNVQEGGGADDAQHAARENQVDAHGQLQAHQQQSSQQHMQQQTQPQHIIVTLQEPQQPMQHQVETKLKFCLNIFVFRFQKFLKKLCFSFFFLIICYI